MPGLPTRNPKFETLEEKQKAATPHRPLTRTEFAARSKMPNVSKPAHSKASRIHSVREEVRPHPNPLLGIRLLDIGQRKIVASRDAISVNRNPRKAFPSTPRTLGALGGYIEVKRLENGLCLRQLAQNLQVPSSIVRAGVGPGESALESALWLHRFSPPHLTRALSTQANATGACCHAKVI